MKGIFTLLLVLLSSGFSIAQKLIYKVNLNDVSNDQLKVETRFSEIKFNSDTLIFAFPKTVPGTYATQDYGKYIENLKAFDSKGNELKVKCKKVNSYYIYKAKDLSKITYTVNDSWDSGEKKDKIFEPAGTNFEDKKNFVLNTGGVFGFLIGYELAANEIKFEKEMSILGSSGMRNIEDLKGQKFMSENYHQTVDCPILFAPPDTARFKVGNAFVLIHCYHESGEKISKKVYNEIKESMGAIEKFLGELPVKNYDFLIYVKDYKAVGKNLEHPENLSLKEKIKLFKMFKGQGFGALEHKNSSLYFLPDFGKDSYLSMVKDVCIHEFMHIITPLNLHSEHISKFNYLNPVMSKHLWLYEGITEYFAGIIQLKGDVLKLNEYLGVMKSKINEAKKYPTEKFSFAEMSANILKKPYKGEYNQVYARGAVMGMLLDFEIMRLTNGEKTLKDVIMSLVKKYGKNKFIPEDKLISEFVNDVHPDLQKFFDDYVTGTKPLNIEGGFATVGLKYIKDYQMTLPKSPAYDNDLKFSPMVMGGFSKVASVGPNEWAGIKPGDLINVGEAYTGCKDADGNFLKEGDKGSMKIQRGTETVVLTFPITYTTRLVKEEILNPENKTPEQEKLFNKWVNN